MDQVAAGSVHSTHAAAAIYYTYMYRKSEREREEISRCATIATAHAINFHFIEHNSCTNKDWMFSMLLGWNFSTFISFFVFLSLSLCLSPLFFISCSFGAFHCRCTPSVSSGKVACFSSNHFPSYSFLFRFNLCFNFLFLTLTSIVYE